MKKPFSGEKADEIEKQELPKFRLKLVGIFHRTSEDLRFAESFIRKADVYLPECFGWTRQFAEQMRQIVEGHLPVDRAKDLRSKGLNGFERREYKLLENSGIRVEFVDASVHDENIVHGSPKHESLYFEAEQAFLSGNFDEALSKYRDYCKYNSRKNHDRELKMSQNINRQLRSECFEGSKERVEVVFPVGIAHIDISLFDSQEIEVERIIPPDYRKTFSHELIRNAWNADDELIMRGLFESFLEMRFTRELTQNTMKAHLAAYALVRQLSLEDIKEIMNKIAEVGMPMPSFLRESINALILEKTQMEIPTTEQEVEALHQKLLRELPTPEVASYDSRVVG